MPLLPQIFDDAGVTYRSEKYVEGILANRLLFISVKPRRL
jgi:hypothetical protein